jgi:asparagine synthase (glutamine-hydrolysing)
MCGISVLLDPARPAAVRERLLRMHAPIRHRGPDGEGFLLAGGGSVHHADSEGALPAAGLPLGFAFRRLRVLDLSRAAAQPMSSPDGRAWIVFNGEIYNHRELRRELEAHGRLFRSHGDTEVALAAYEAWGEAAFERLDGMWAIAIADLGRGRLVLSRDRFGIKPLYWTIDEGALLAASEIRQILAGRCGRARANASLVHRYLSGSRYPCLEETFFEGIRSVPPATWCALPLDAPASEPSFRPYWRLEDSHAAAAAPSYAEARERFGAALEGAVRSHAVADVRVGTLLSGGLDSAAIASLLGRDARAGGRAIPAFSFGVPGTEGCELDLAATVARTHGLEHHQAGMDAAWLRDNAAAVVRALEEPPLALPALAQHRTFALCRRHDTTVVLDGQGADEVLGGYPYHQRLLLVDRLRRGRLLAFAAEMRAIGRREHAGTARLLSALVAPPLGTRFRRAPGWLAPPPAADEDERRRARQDRGRDPSLLNRQLYWDVKWGNVKIVLCYTDKNAMAHSVEARVPFFDRRLVELAFSLPDEHKVGDGQRKRILRDTVRGLVPSEVTDRADRLGFALPERALLRGFWPLGREVVAASGLLDAPRWVRPRAARALAAGYEAGDDAEARTLWRLAALSLWAREFDVTLA